MPVVNEEGVVVNVISQTTLVRFFQSHSDLIPDSFKEAVVSSEFPNKVCACLWCLSVCGVCLSVCLSVCRSVCLSVHGRGASACFVCLSVVCTEGGTGLD